MVEAVTFGWLRPFRLTMSDAMASRDVYLLRTLAKVAEKQADELSARLVGMGPLVDWPALRESWAQDARRLRAAVDKLEGA